MSTLLCLLLFLIQIDQLLVNQKMELAEGINKDLFHICQIHTDTVTDIMTPSSEWLSISF